MRKQPASETLQAQTAVMDALQEPLLATAGGSAIASVEASAPLAPARRKRSLPAAPPVHRFAAPRLEDDSSNRQAELFYLQKQIQQQTQMVFILEDGERIQGVIEWYDRHSIKVRGKSRVLLYKSAIKYLYKSGEVGSAPEK